MRLMLGALLLVCAVLVTAPVRAQGAYVTYDVFMNLGHAGRLGRFGQLTPEEAAEAFTLRGSLIQAQ